MAKRNAGWGVAGKARQPKASVIIPTFMEEKYLGSTLDSIMAQRPGFGFEVIVSDAKSTDGTAKIARQRGARVVLCPKTTIAEGRVVGASAANGEILVFATADNYYYPDWLSDMIRPFSDKKISGVIGKVRMKEKSLTEKIFCEYIIYPIGVGFSKIGLYFANGESLAVRKSVYYRIGGIKKMLETSDD
ncbi:glycosyltransferase, partial [Candidatus Parvarchaeota archaeon]|nr:glycosyltransferase [Candidatus Parvarchaeota archaeon]